MGSTAQAGPSPDTASTVDGRIEGSESQSLESRGGVMRAIVQDAYGSAEVLRLAEIDMPDIAPGEVLVQVRAAGLDRGTSHFMTAQPYLMRVMGFGFRRPKNPVAGLDVLAGKVRESD